MSAKNFDVGQELWYVPRWGRLSECHAVKITKIGRKWLELSNGLKADVKTLKSFQDQLYLSEADHAKERAMQAAWNALERRMSNAKPSVTVRRIKLAEKLLGLEPKP
jgi:hypothetical protein